MEGTCGEDIVRVASFTYVGEGEDQCREKRNKGPIPGGVGRHFVAGLMPAFSSTSFQKSSVVVVSITSSSRMSTEERLRAH